MTFIVLARDRKAANALFLTLSTRQAQTAEPLTPVILLKYAKHHQILVQASHFIFKDRREEIQAAGLIRKCVFSSHNLECI